MMKNSHKQTLSRSLTGLAVAGSLLTSCAEAGKFGELAQETPNIYQLNPIGVRNTIESVATISKLPSRYKIISGKRTGDYTEIQIDDNKVNMRILIFRVKKSDPSDTEKDLVTRFAKQGVLFKSAVSSNYSAGEMTVKDSGTIEVAGRKMYYQIGHKPKPYFGPDTLIPAFIGCVMGDKNFTLFYAAESDGWLPEKKREQIKIDYETGEQTGYKPEWVNEEHVMKDFDLEAMKNFLSYITAFN